MASDQKEKKKKRPPAELLVGGAVATTPFAGMIGQEREKDPLKELQRQGKRPVGSHEALKKQIQPGDVILESVPPRQREVRPFGQNRRSLKIDEPEFSNFNKSVSSGSRWHHAEVVQDNKRSTFTGIPQHFDGNVSRNMESFGDSDLVVLRRKSDKPQTAAQRKKVVKATRKLRDQTWGGKPQKQLNNLSERIFASQRVPEKVKNVATGTLDSLAEGPATTKAIGKDWFMPKLRKKKIKSYAKDCADGVCSASGEAVAYDAKTNKSGKGAVRGKVPNEMLPADYLRSGDYEVVTVKTKGRKFKYQDIRNFKARQLATRAGVGLALGATAAGAVAAGKYFTRKRNKD